MIDRADIDAVLEEAGQQLAQVRGMYEQSLRAKEIPVQLKTRIKNVLENQRSALEYVTHAIYNEHGDGKGARSYYPAAPSAAVFSASFDRVLPGVASNAPRVRAAIEARQPYQPDYDWLSDLVALTNENKHRRLTPQTRTEQRRVRVEMLHGGSVDWAPEAVQFGPGVLIGGVPVDPSTQRPVPSPTQTVTETIYVDWLFEQSRRSALGTIERIQTELPGLINAVLATV